VVLREGTFHLEDLKSTNGTFVRITARRLLRTGRAEQPETIDVLLVGGVLIRIVETG
jgi:pSer/pThr/pTyr-binding forkhead associated (FHA) protein